MTELVAADIGGTHARFALARLDGAGRVAELGDPVVLRCADHADLAAAWAAFGAALSGPLPRAAAIAVAGPVAGVAAGLAAGDELRLTNNHWVIRPAQLRAQLGLDAHVLINDFAAVAHFVAHAMTADDSGQFAPVCGPHASPDAALPAAGPITVLGPGTGLGAAVLIRAGSDWQVLPCEAGHGDFAPVDSVDDAILAHFRRKFGRVSAERVISGPGLADIRAVLAELEGGDASPIDDARLWQLALAGEDRLAAAALERFCCALGSFAGNMALAHGAGGVVIGGGLGARLAAHLPRSGFAARFVAKGRFAALLGSVPVKLITHPQPGLLGAAAAFGRTMQ